MPLRVIVTGAARGYGELLSERLAAAGCRVGVLGRDPARVAATALAVDGVALVADVLEQAAVRSAIDSFANSEGGIDARSTTRV